MGTGSFSYFSHWARGSTGNEFAAVVDKVMASGLSDLIIVSNAYLGGLHTEWSRVYETTLANRHLKWRSFEQWVGNVKINAQPLVEIPVNREVKYDVPKPAVSL